MSDPHEPILFSPLLSPLPNGQPVPDSTSEQSLHSMGASFQQAIMEHRLAHHTAPILRLSHVSVRFTLRPMPSRMPRDMAYLWQVANYTVPTPPAIRALVYSLMRAYQPWFLFAGIVMTPV